MTANQQSDISSAVDREIALLQQISFKSDRFRWLIDECSIKAGEWICFTPDADEIYPDASISLARVISTLESDFSGTLKLFGDEISLMDYDSRLEVRRHIGYIHSSGALLANRTLLQNIRYPLDFHQTPPKNPAETDREILQLMVIMGISPYRDYRIQNIDEIIRWRTCVCRALVTNPDWLIFEGIGDWSYSHGCGLVWHYLKEQVRKQQRTVSFCLPKKNPFFEKWITDNGGRIVQYRLAEE